MSWKIAGSRPDEVNDFFPIYLILPATIGPGVYSASNRNGYQDSSRDKGRPARKADNLTFICEISRYLLRYLKVDHAYFYFSNRKFNNHSMWHA
jgi:hypothetical protein